jgi:hypothetical protein
MSVCHGFDYDLVGKHHLPRDINSNRMDRPVLSHNLLLSVCVSTRMVVRKTSLQTYRQLVDIPSPHYPTNLTIPGIGRENSQNHSKPRVPGYG